MWQIAGEKWPYLFPILPFIYSFATWLCHSRIKGGPCFPSFESRLILQLALTHRHGRSNTTPARSRGVSRCRNSPCPQRLQPEPAWTVTEHAAVLCRPKRGPPRTASADASSRPEAPSGWDKSTLPAVKLRDE